MLPSMYASDGGATEDKTARHVIDQCATEALGLAGEEPLHPPSGDEGSIRTRSRASITAFGLIAVL